MDLNKQSLDRYITGNWGEDQFKEQDVYSAQLYNTKFWSNSSRQDYDYKAGIIEKLYKDILSCNKCKELNKISQIEDSLCVCPRGNIDAELMIVGQSNARPQSQYSEHNKFHPNVPFLYGCGELLNQCLDAINLTREDVWITNVVKGHPPGNRPSYNHEIIACKDYLNKEIEVINPKVIIPLGKDAYEWFAKKYKGDLLKYRHFSRIIDVPDTNFLLVPLYHPSYVLYRQHKPEELIKSFKSLVSMALLEYNRLKVKKCQQTKLED